MGKASLGSLVVPIKAEAHHFLQEIGLDWLLATFLKTYFQEMLSRTTTTCSIRQCCFDIVAGVEGLNRGTSYRPSVCNTMYKNNGNRRFVLCQLMVGGSRKSFPLHLYFVVQVGETRLVFDRYFLSVTLLLDIFNRLDAVKDGRMNILP